MPGSVAVLSDIHGVLPALDAVLAEPAVAAADRIVLTGDIAAGPQPGPVLERLLALGDRAVWLRGNADRELVEARRGGEVTIPDPIAPWAARQLTPEHVELLAGLPYPLTLDIGGFGPVLFCHATPRDDEEVVLVDSRTERWGEVLADLPDDVSTVVCGHTHMPFVRRTHGLLVVNPGSVGMPYGRRGADWALLGGGAVTLAHTDFDADAACAAIVADSTYPDVEQWVEDYVRTSASDLEALAVFGPRDGR